MKSVKILLETKTKKERQEHLDLSEPCIERGGGSMSHRGVLAVYLDTDMPSGQNICLCHACHNAKCSNPKHLYWGNHKDNGEDTVQNGSHNFLGGPYNKIVHTCPKCGKVGKGNAMKQWHFDNCKLSHTLEITAI